MLLNKSVTEDIVKYLSRMSRKLAHSTNMCCRGQNQSFAASLTRRSLLWSFCITDITTHTTPLVFWTCWTTPSGSWLTSSTEVTHQAQHYTVSKLNW